MNGYRVVVPSHDRPVALHTKTLPTLVAGGVPRERIDVWVAPSQLMQYQDVCAAHAVHLRTGALGLAAQRWAITTGYAEGTQLVHVDDDVSAVVRKVGNKVVPVSDLPGLFAQGFAAMAEHGASLWGIYPVPNGMFMRDEVQTGLRYVVGCLWGQLADPDQVRWKVLNSDCEDYERTMRCYQADGTVVRLANYAPRTAYFTERGGLAGQRTLATRQAAIDHLLATYPGLCRAAKPRVRGGVAWPELRMVRA